MWKYLLLLTCSLMNSCQGYRLLGFFPITGKSQQLMFQPILHELAKRGHEVVFVTTIRPDFSHPNLEVRLIEPYIHVYENLAAYKSASVFMQNYLFSKMSLDSVDYFYGNPTAQRLIHSNESYDAVLLESYWMQEPVSAFIHKFNCPAIEISTFGDFAWMNEQAGLPDNPSYQLDYKAWTTDTMSFLERVRNFYISWSSWIVGYYHLWKMQAVMDKYFNYAGWESRPSINELVTNRSIILVNQDVALDYPFPLAPHVKRIGGVNVLPIKPLPREIKRFMDTATDGFIYFALGSNLKTSELVQTDFGKAFLSVFENIPQKVVMKWEANEKIKLPSNVMTYKWLPQGDVLNHTNCVLFISHGGYLSLTEATHNGVPILGIPFFGDQPKNMRSIENIGNGIRLLYENVTKESVSWAVNELLYNPRMVREGPAPDCFYCNKSVLNTSTVVRQRPCITDRVSDSLLLLKSFLDVGRYKKEAVRRSEIIKNRLVPPLEEAIYWIEFAIKYPNLLTPRSANLNFFQLYTIDVKIFLLACLYILYRIIKYSVHKLSSVYMIPINILYSMNDNMKKKTD